MRANPRQSPKRSTKMKRVNVHSLAGLLLAIGLLAGCGTPDESSSGSDSHEGQAQAIQLTISTTQTASNEETSLANSTQPPVSNEGADLESDATDLLACKVVDWEIRYCSPFKFICTHTGDVSCCVPYCQSKCKSVCGFSATTCKRVCVF